jgi:hypothetical protein
MAGHLGGGDVFDRAIAGFAANDAAANERDHAALLDALTSGRMAANNPAQKLLRPKFAHVECRRAGALAFARRGSTSITCETRKGT